MKGTEELQNALLQMRDAQVESQKSPHDCAQWAAEAVPLLLPQDQEDCKVVGIAGLSI